MPLRRKGLGSFGFQLFPGLHWGKPHAFLPFQMEGLPSTVSQEKGWRGLVSLRGDLLPVPELVSEAAGRHHSLLGGYLGV